MNFYFQSRNLNNGYLVPVLHCCTVCACVWCLGVEWVKAIHLSLVKVKESCSDLRNTAAQHLVVWPLSCSSEWVALWVISQEAWKHACVRTRTEESWFPKNRLGQLYTNSVPSSQKPLACLRKICFRGPNTFSFSISWVDTALQDKFGSHVMKMAWPLSVWIFEWSQAYFLPTISKVILSNTWFYSGFEIWIWLLWKLTVNQELNSSTIHSWEEIVGSSVADGLIWWSKEGFVDEGERMVWNSQQLHRKTVTRPSRPSDMRSVVRDYIHS